MAVESVDGRSAQRSEVDISRLNMPHIPHDDRDMSPTPQFQPFRNGTMRSTKSVPALQLEWDSDHPCPVHGPNEVPMMSYRTLPPFVSAPPPTAMTMRRFGSALDIRDGRTSTLPLLINGKRDKKYAHSVIGPTMVHPSHFMQPMFARPMFFPAYADHPPIHLSRDPYTGKISSPAPSTYGKWEHGTCDDYRMNIGPAIVHPTRRMPMYSPQPMFYPAFSDNHSIHLTRDPFTGKVASPVPSTLAKLDPSTSDEYQQVDDVCCRGHLIVLWIILGVVTVGVISGIILAVTMN